MDQQSEGISVEAWARGNGLQREPTAMHLHRTLLELAKDPSVTVVSFMESARDYPEELSLTDDYGLDADASHGSSPSFGSMRSLDMEFGSGKGGSSNDQMFLSQRLKQKTGLTRMAAAASATAAAARAHALNAIGGSGVAGSGDAEERVTFERNLTALHYLFGRAEENFGFDVIAELISLDEDCLGRNSSWQRTPVHHLLQHNKLSEELIVAIHVGDKGALVKKDRWGGTPLCRYFKRNPVSVGMDVENDLVVRTLCSASGYWGLSVLSCSNEAFTVSVEGAQASAKYSAGRLPPKFNVLFGGNLFEVESFVRDFMKIRDDDVDEFLLESRIKFLFLLLPLRTPTKYGLTPTQGLQLVTRVLISMENVYADASGKGSDEAKQRWMGAFADAALFMIQDDQMLRGMLSDPPSKAAVEALSSTEFMTTVLSYKFSSGPILLFLGEFALHIFLFALVISNMVSTVSHIYLAVPALLINLYFTVREVHFMWKVRAQEMVSYSHGRVQEAWGGMGKQAKRRNSLTNEELNIGSKKKTSAEVKSLFRAAVLKAAREQAAKSVSEAESSNDSDSFRANADWTDNPFQRIKKTESERFTGFSNKRQNALLESPSPRTSIPARRAGGLAAAMPGIAHAVASSGEGSRGNADELIDGEGGDGDDLEGGGGLEAMVEGLSRFVTIYLGLAESWRHSAFNWINLGSHVCCWITIVNMLVVAAEGVSNCDGNTTSGDRWARGHHWVLSLHVCTIFFLSLRVLGFLRGTSIEMATFVLMLQEITWRVQTFLMMLLWILFSFALAYHVLLVGEDLDDDTWSSFHGSLWTLWGYAITGEMDDTAFPTAGAYPLFAIFGLAIVIVMMNILIAIVSDAFEDSMRRSAPLFWRARVDLIASYEHVLPTLNEDPQKLLSTTGIALSERSVLPPRTWQYRCLKVQEGLVFTALVCGIVVFELIYVSSLTDDCSNKNNDDDSFDDAFWWSFGVSMFFFAEILLRYYNWKHSIKSMRLRDGKAASATSLGSGNFFTDKFRVLDAAIVVMDLAINLLQIIFILKFSEEELKGGGGCEARSSAALSPRCTRRSSLADLQVCRKAHGALAALRETGQARGRRLPHRSPPDPR